MRKRPLPPLTSLHGGGVTLPPGARARVHTNPGHKPVVVYRDPAGEHELKQPLRADAAGRLPGFAKSQRVTVESTGRAHSITSKAASSHKPEPSPPRRRRPATSRSSAHIRRAPRHAPAAPRTGRRASAELRHLLKNAPPATGAHHRVAPTSGTWASEMLSAIPRVESPAVIRGPRASEMLRTPPELLASRVLAEIPSAVEITIGSALDLTVASVIPPLTFELDPTYGPSARVSCPGFGVAPNGHPYWDPEGVDSGDEASLFLNPLTLDLTLQREDS